VTVAEAMGKVQRVGAVEVSGGSLRLRFPESMRAVLQSAVDTLRTGKAEALALLAEMDPGELTRERWCPKGIGWAEWKAAELNRFFQAQGVTRQLGRITAATVLHGERKRGTPPGTERSLTANGPDAKGDMVC
jgi:hypothetical protein